LFGVFIQGAASAPTHTGHNLYPGVSSAVVDVDCSIA